MKESKVQRVGVRAIDVGYSNVKYTTGREAKEHNTISVGIFPSVAAYLGAGSGTQTIEGAAEQLGVAVTVDGQSYYVGRDVARHCAGVISRPVDEKYSTTPTYMALMMGALNEITKAAGNPEHLIIEALVLGLPLSTCAKYAPTLKEKMRGEHVITNDTAGRRSVLVGAVHVVPQPHGALLNYAYENADEVEDGFILVVDPGGGTVDWYMADVAGPAWGRSGAYPRAMLACAFAIADQIPDTKRDDVNVVLRIEKALSGDAPFFRVNGHEYDIKAFQPVIDAVLREPYTKMRDRVGTWSDVDRIVLTGGGAHQMGAFMIKEEPSLVHRIKIPDQQLFANAVGFHLFGERLRARAGAGPA